MAADDNFLPVGYSFDISYNTTVLKSFLDFGEKNIENEIEGIRKEYEARLKNIPFGWKGEDPERFNEERANIWDFLHDDWYMMDVEIRSRFRQSVLIQLYSFMESQLYKQCDLHQWKNNKEYSVKELKGNTDLERVYTYYKKSAGINIKEVEQWKFIDDFRRLRNIIVHKEGLITNEDDFNRMNKFSTDNFELNRVIDNHQIVLSDRKFIDKCIDNVKSFLSHLIIS